VLNLGNVYGATKLDQILEQLGVSESDYLYWNSKDKIKIRIPPELYVPNFGGAPPAKDKKKLEESKESVLSASDP